MRSRITSALLLAVAVAALAGFGQAGTDHSAAVDRVFARWNDKTPGCAVGVSVRGKPVIEKAYGMTDLEHDVRNAPDTIFEAGSVSKQFTAAAVLLLAKDGKLSLDDPVRKYIPELPDYKMPLTIRHMLTHTSGLRDWGGVASIAGWPRTTRVHTHAHVLDIVSRQKSLNFPAGTRYSYSNTGYNLAAILVSRVSGRPFAEFTHERIFAPLGMSRTSWRDDFTRIVKGRAIAYAESHGELTMDMPFENVHGNGGLLTTVGDLLRWTANFESAQVGGPELVNEQQEPGRFTDGRQHGYALGLQIGEYRGIKEVAHSGATAGYRAHLVTYPSQRVSVAVLCNAGSGAATQYARAVSDLYLAGLAPASKAPTGADGVPTGLHRNTVTGAPALLVEQAVGRKLEMGAAGEVRLVDRYGTVDTYVPVPEAERGPRPLTDYVGEYTSDEADVVFRVVVQDDRLVIKRRPDTSIRLTPVYADAFEGSVGLVRFQRARLDGPVTSLSVGQDRVWDLRFTRQPGSENP